MNKLKSFAASLWQYEIIRYVFAGGMAFIADKLLFFIANTFLLPEIGSWWVFENTTNMIAVLIGFAAGTIVNNTLSASVVFRGAERQKSRTASAGVVFTAVGFVGLLLSIEGNQLLIHALGSGKIKELIYNVIVALPVTAWNYLGRKFFVTMLVKKSENI